jgi:hypothetical protein
MINQRYHNYGQYLYEEAKIIKERQEELAKQQEKLNAAMVDVEATFHPKINHYYRPMYTSQKNVLDRVMEKTVKRPKPELPEDESEAHLTFHPKISRKTEQIMREKRYRESIYNENPQEHGMRHYEQLFYDAERRRARMQEGQYHIPADATFKPDIGRNAYLRLDEDQEEFINRLVNSKKESEKSLAQLRMQLNSNVDPDTGRELFKPMISKHPNLSERKQQVHHELYNLKDEFKEDKNRLAASYDESLKKMANQTHTTANSEKIVQYSKLRKIAEMFEFFDTDRDGYINIKDNVNSLRLLEPELVKDLVYVFRQFDEDSLISYEEFVDHMLARVEDTRLQGAKTTLLASFSRSKKRAFESTDPDHSSRFSTSNKEYTFKPRVNKHSEFLVNMHEERKRALSAGRIHEVLIGEQGRWKARKELLKEELIDNEMKECTFHPNTSKTLHQRRSITPDNLHRKRNKLPMDEAQVDELTKRLASVKPKIPTEKTRSTEQRELMEHCTFTPTTFKSKSSFAHLNRSLLSLPPGGESDQNQLNTSYSSIHQMRTPVAANIRDTLSDYPSNTSTVIRKKTKSAVI